MSEVLGRARFDLLRYAQVWEDAEVLLGGLGVREGDTVVSVASAGDNALALLSEDPGKVVALDVSVPQLCALELRVAALRTLTHPELLELVGSRPSDRRPELYARCRPLLGTDARAFWDARPGAVRAGIGGAGRFEGYFRLFRRAVLPLILTPADRRALLQPRSPAQRERFFRERVDTWRWRLLLRAFFSRSAMGRLGRDPEFFRYVQGPVSDHVRRRARHALVHLDPSENPYLHWIMTGTHPGALPTWLQPDRHARIVANLDRLEWHHAPLEAYLESVAPRSVDRFNLSDIFEYMSQDATATLLSRIADAARPGGRLLYWNMLAPRSRPEFLAGRLRPLPDLAASLHERDRAFFYSRLVVEEVV